jgi:hypothetical protein
MAVLQPASMDIATFETDCEKQSVNGGGRWLWAPGQGFDSAPTFYKRLYNKFDDRLTQLVASLHSKDVEDTRWL